MNCWNRIERDNLKVELMIKAAAPQQKYNSGRLEGSAFLLPPSLSWWMQGFAGTGELRCAWPQCLVLCAVSPQFVQQIMLSSIGIF